MKIIKLVLGSYETNCYILVNEEKEECVIIDPACNPELIEEKILESGAKPVGILLTHGHFDHIMGAIPLAEKFQMPIYASEKEEQVLLRPECNLTAESPEPLSFIPNKGLTDGEKIELAGVQFEVFETPGHTEGSSSYYCEKLGLLFSGDTLMRETVGRTDLPTGNTFALIGAIRGKLYKLPEETIVYPGHGEATDIGHEKKNNPYVRSRR